MGKAINMIDYEFQTWKVISQSDIKKSNNNIYWNCKCQNCGRERTFCGSEIRLNRTGKCKCTNKQQKEKKEKKSRIKNEVGNIYGFLTVKSLAYTKNSFAYWNCQCKCGKMIIVRGNSLRNQQVHSCGCLRSYQEEKIRQLLDSLHILYQREYIFPDLKDKSHLRFDFAIFDQNKQLLGLIEYQGQQHYDEPCEFNHYGILQVHDNMKREYCLKNNIPLLELNKDSKINEEVLSFIKIN